MKEEVKIEKVGLEGQGVAFDHHGNIYFVPGAVPGDTVTVEYEETHKRFRDSSLIEVTSPSPDRQDPQCTYFGECGGCDFLHWKYESQLKAKEGILTHAFGKAGWEPKVFHPMIPSPKTYGYRNRVQVRHEGGKLGFYRKRSHEIVDVDHCIVADPKINEALKQIRLQPASQMREKIELGIASDGAVHEVKNKMHAALGFNQINAEQNVQLQALVRKYLTEGVAKNVLELYCGDGNLSFAFQSDVQKTLAFDSSLPAIETARSRNKNTETLAFFCDQVDQTLPRKLPTDFRKSYDTLVTDPPRQGMTGGLEPFLHSQLRRIIYISCSVIAFSKDTACLKKDFVLQEVQPIDMFPHTRHIEFVSVFVRQ